MKKFLSILFAAALVLSMVGCNGGGQPSSPASGSDASGSDASGSDAETLVIGMTTPLTGNFAEFGKTFQVSAQMAVDDFNAAGGVNGKMVKLEVMDSKGDPKEATEIASKFGQNPDVLAVVGDFSSSCCMAAAPIYGENHLSLVSPTASHIDFAPMNEYMFGVAGIDEGQAGYQAEFLTKKFLKSEAAALIYVNNDWGVGSKENYVARAEQCGLNLVAVESFMETDNDFNALLTKVRQANPDTLAILAQGDTVVKIVKQVRQMDWDVQIALSSTAYSPQLITLGGEDMNGVFVPPLSFIDESNPRGLAFIEEFNKRAGYEPSQHGFLSYDATTIVMEAMVRADNAGKLTREGIRDEIQATKNYDGMTGPLDEFRPEGNVISRYLIVTVENGEFKKVAGYELMDE